MTLPVISVIIAGIGLLLAGIGFFVSQTVSLARSVAQVSERVAGLERDNQTFWSVIGPHMAKVIHQDTAAERDELVDRFIGRQKLTPDELTRLLTLLRDVANDEAKKSGERLAASLLIARAQMEIEHNQPDDVFVALPSRKKRWWRR